MNSLSGLNGCVNGSNEFRQIENENSNHISNVMSSDSFITEYDGNCPPKTGTVH